MTNPTSPTLLTPNDDSSVVGNALIFTFTVPSDSDNDKLVFKIELDINNPINISSPRYKSNESRFTQGRWEVKNNLDNWENIASGGIGSAYYGKEAKITLIKQDVTSYPDTTQKWHWRILAADGMVQNPVFNQVVFGQCVFKSV